VKIVPAPVNEKIYGNPGFGGMMYTAGSNAVTSYYQPLCFIGAQVRRVLLDNAARKWGVSVEELTTEPSVVVHAKSGRLFRWCRRRSWSVSYRLSLQDLGVQMSHCVRRPIWASGRRPPSRLVTRLPVTIGREIGLPAADLH
jgi:CO/xanthine dehydrogenase Mo-binding subunit